MLRLQAADLQHPGLMHGFFGRTGGVSTGIYASLNCGPGSRDNRAAVIENRRRARNVLSELGRELLTLYQVHSARVVTVAQPWSIGEAPQADALVTNLPGIALGILTADCAPVLLADAEAKVIGAAHAGWQGASAGVIAAVVDAMESLGARRTQIAAAVGPCISQANYEVGPEFVARFRAADEGNGRWFLPSPRPDHFRFDLSGYVVDRLADAGISMVARIARCTYADETEFFSFRRATHRGEPDYGRQLSAILLTP